jgi:Resolvase, N terminal domain
MGDTRGGPNKTCIQNSNKRCRPHSMKTKRIIIYGRVSTAEQRHDSQIAEVQDYCARRWGDNVAVTVITDTASGAKTSRDGLDQVMQLVRRNRVDVVACFKLERHPAWIGVPFIAECPRCCVRAKYLSRIATLRKAGRSISQTRLNRPIVRCRSANVTRCGKRFAARAI